MGVILKTQSDTALDHFTCMARLIFLLLGYHGHGASSSEISRVGKCRKTKFTEIQTLSRHIESFVQYS